MMNDTTDSSSHGVRSINMSQESIADVSYSIGFSLAILLVLVIISYVSYKCNRSSAITNRNFSSRGSSIRAATTTIDDESVTAPQGLDEATLVNYPKFLYSEAKPRKGDSVVSGCSICLADYKDDHMLRLLPDCGHLFHLKCIDPWLKLHPSCPICRTTPLPTPTATPLAEVVPLAIHQS